MNQRRRTSVPSNAVLPELVNQNIESIVALHANAERRLSKHRRFVSKVTHFFSRPAFLYFIVAVTVLWTVINVAPKAWGLPQFDPPPFSDLGFFLSVGSLFVTVGVLIEQDRQERVAEQRAQLGLQLGLLSEQKITKLIGLIEELRRDLPDVHNRVDSEAEAMQEVVDPHHVLDELQGSLSEVLVEVQKEAPGTP